MIDDLKKLYWKAVGTRLPWAMQLSRATLKRSCSVLGVSSLRVKLPRWSPLYRGNGGELLELRVDDMIMPAVLESWTWQLDEVEFIARHLPQQPHVLIDVGANIGLVTRQLIHRLPNIAHAVCFEPHPENFRVMCANLAHIPDCSPVQAAMGADDGELHFYEEVQNVGNYSLNADAMRGKEFRRSVVTCLRADETHILRSLPRAAASLPIIWKSDTQGFDETIMTTLPDAFWSRVQVGVMEIWRIDRPAFDRQRLAAILDQFEVLRFADAPEVNVSAEDVARYSEGVDYRHRDVHFARA